MYDLVSKQVQYFLFHLQAASLRSVACVCVYVFNTCVQHSPHLPPIGDFGDGCYGDTSDAADELMGCICLSLPMSDCYMMIHRWH